MMKFCKHCNAEFDIDGEHWQKLKSPSCKGGFRYRCKITQNKKHLNYYYAHKEKFLEQQSVYRQNNKEKIKIKDQKYYKNNKKRINQYCNQYHNQRKRTDVQYKLRCNLRIRLNHVLKNNIKVGSAVKDLGCSIEFLKQHLESKFQPGMSWDNYGNKAGQWSIDHIKPLSKFDLTNREQFLKACHYTNLQPMWHIDNIKKGSKNF